MIEFQYFKGCPNSAEKLYFQGSPTILYNGYDIYIQRLSQILTVLAFESIILKESRRESCLKTSLKLNGRLHLHLLLKGRKSAWNFSTSYPQAIRLLIHRLVSWTKKSEANSRRVIAGFVDDWANLSSTYSSACHLTDLPVDWC